MLDEHTKSIILRIIEFGLLNIRFYAQEGDCEQALNEVNHIHNLPALLQDGNLSNLRYYISTERESYLRHTTGKAPMRFDDLWQELDTKLSH